MYLKQHGLKLINGSKTDLLNEFSLARGNAGRDVLEDEEWRGEEVRKLIFAK